MVLWWGSIWHWNIWQCLSPCGPRVMLKYCPRISDSQLPFIHRIESLSGPAEGVGPVLFSTLYRQPLCFTTLLIMLRPIWRGHRCGLTSTLNARITSHLLLSPGLQECLLAILAVLGGPLSATSSLRTGQGGHFARAFLAGTCSGSFLVRWAPDRPPSCHAMPDL